MSIFLVARLVDAEKVDDKEPRATGQNREAYGVFIPQPPLAAQVPVQNKEHG